MNFMVIFGTVFIVAIASLVYFWLGFHRFETVRRYAREHKKLSWLVAAIPVFVIVLFLIFKTVATVVAVLHLLVFWIVCDLAGWVVKKAAGKKSFKRYYQGIFAICITVVYMYGAYYMAHHVYRTDYVIEASKDLGTDRLRIAMIADAHIGSTFDGEGFAGHMEAVAEAQPDVVVIVGDFVDDDTSAADMVMACEALGRLNPKYGTYFVYGNHDKGYYDHRDFKTTDLVDELEKNGVTVLEDETVMLNDNIYLVGRKDKSTAARASMDRLVSGLDMDKYIIVLDHQPNDYKNQAEACVDLVLSGHTHGGWLFPVNVISKYFGPDDMIYGAENRDDTDFIVTSGISDWALPFKTGTIAEYVIIDIFCGV
ncbi:MAG: metallophosphoesterase [Lachnospiraceae bacterium]